MRIVRNVAATLGLALWAVACGGETEVTNTLTPEEQAGVQQRQSAMSAATAEMEKKKQQLVPQTPGAPTPPAPAPTP